MNEPNANQIPRRTFLQGAAAALGTSLLGLAPIGALANPLLAGLSRQPALAFWNGSRFVPTSAITPDGSLAGAVRITVASYQKGSLRSIDLYHFVEIDGVKKAVPFFAWTAGLTGVSGSRFTAQIDPVEGLQLDVTEVVDGQKTVSKVQLGGATGQPLKAGTYAIGPSGSDLTVFAVAEKEKVAPLARLAGSGPSPQYVLLRIERI